MSTSDRAAIRAVKKKLKAYDLTPEELERTKRVLIELRDNSRDPRVVFNSCKELRDGCYNVYEHQNPAETKQTITHNFPTKLGIKIYGKTAPSA